jgi:hypothetical protein
VTLFHVHIMISKLITAGIALNRDRSEINLRAYIKNASTALATVQSLRMHSQRKAIEEALKPLEGIREMLLMDEAGRHEKGACKFFYSLTRPHI